jgi:hypothetical protein
MSAERLLMNEYKALSKELWTNVEVSLSGSCESPSIAGIQADHLSSSSTTTFSNGASP